MPFLLLDCDGVLADTERDGHRVAFNRAFREMGLPLEWDDPTYARLLGIGGGKERLSSVLSPDVMAARGLEDTPGERARLVAEVHALKSELFRGIVADGLVPARPGIRRLVIEATASGWTVAVASTSAPESVRAVMETVLGAGLASGIEVFAGDVVARKKPDPAIYKHAVQQLGASPGDCVVVEDSSQGLAAARGASLPVVVTESAYTHGEDFTGASLVLSDLGEPDAPAVVLADPCDLMVGCPAVDVAVLGDVISRHRG